MKIEPIESIDQIKKILTIVGLPTEDLPQLTNAKFFGITNSSALLAVVGLELYGEAGLLRSLAVLPSSQGTGIGNNLSNYPKVIVYFSPNPASMVNTCPFMSW